MTYSLTPPRVRFKRPLSLVALPLAAVLLLGGCAVAPSGPSVMVYPGSGKSFDQFRVDDMQCRTYAKDSSGGATGSSGQMESGLRTGALGTVVGALVGGALGGRSGAQQGAGVGLGLGTLGGLESGSRSGDTAQHRYDNAYLQCMYATGNKVPVAGGMMQGPTPQPAPAVAPPPPPPGNPPPAPSK